LQAIAMISYAMSASVFGLLAATTLYAIGSAFWNGVGESLLFDSVEGCGMAGTYERVHGVVASVALPISGALLIGVPFIYALNQRSPFYLNACFLGVCGLVAMTLRTSRSHTGSARVSHL